MRIVFWNCNGAFRNKYEYVKKFRADLYIIAESECVSKITNQNFLQDIQFKNSLHFPGDKRGLLVFTMNAQKIIPLSWDDFRMRYYMPFKFAGKTFLGIWAKDNYIEDEYVYTKFHLQDLRDTILIGDFNSNVIWDHEHGYRTHTDFNRLMHSIDHVSAYHEQTNEPFGEETQPSFYMHRKVDRPYHIDYAYLPTDQKYKISFGNRNFLSYSDHLPLILDIVD